MLWITRTGVAGLLIVLPLAAASASVVQQVSSAERRVWPSVSDAAPFSGEIEYSFDTAANVTRARFKASLASENALVKLFMPATVHTIVAVYEFRGRSPVDHPESLRLTLISDEYKHAASRYSPMLSARPILMASLGDTVVSYSLGIAQKVEEWVAPNMESLVSRPSNGDQFGRYHSQLPHEIHIERTATAWIPICDFLTLVNARTVHGTVAGLEFDLNDRVVSGLRRFAAQMIPDAPLKRDTNCR